MWLSFRASRTAQAGSWVWVQLPYRQLEDSLNISGKKCDTSYWSNSMVPNPRTPGVSIIHPPASPGRGNISEKVVVCIPVS